MKRLTSLAITSILCFGLTSQASALVLTGPTLPRNGGVTGGWEYSGLSITALEDVTLESFVFINPRNLPDTLLLTDADGNVLYSHSYAGGETEYLADVSWALSEGETYRLLEVGESNASYRDVAEGYYPLSNDHLQVNGTVDEDGNIITSYWFYFEDLTTEPVATPEPATLLLFGIGMAGMAARRWSGRRAARN